MINFEFSNSSTDLFNPQNYLDSVYDSFEFSRNVNQTEVIDEQDQYDDNFDDGADFDNILDNNENVIPLILGEIKSVGGLVGGSYGDDEEHLGVTQNSQEMFSYFDTSVGNAWIGPEYWRPSKNVTEKKPRAEGAKSRSKKDVPALTLKDLLVQGRNIHLPKSSFKSDNLLPKQDFNFNNDRMVSLFTRPKWKMGWQKRDGTIKKAVQEVQGF